MKLIWLTFLLAGCTDISNLRVVDVYYLKRDLRGDPMFYNIDRQSYGYAAVPVATGLKPGDVWRLPSGGVRNGFRYYVVNEGEFSFATGYDCSNTSGWNHHAVCYLDDGVKVVPLMEHLKSPHKLITVETFAEKMLLIQDERTRSNAAGQAMSGFVPTVKGDINSQDNSQR